MSVTPVKVILPPDIIARAMYTAQERPKYVRKVNVSPDPQADLVGATAEHAWPLLYTMSQNLVRYDLVGGDGGEDFLMKQGIVDIKSSQKHRDSWTVKMGDLHADWYVFAYVELPDKVWFVAKAPRHVVEPIGETYVKGARIVRFPATPGTTAFRKEDFSPPE